MPESPTPRPEPRGGAGRVGGGAGRVGGGAGRVGSGAGRVGSGAERVGGGAGRVGSGAGRVGSGAERVERRRDEIIEVAGRVFAEKGYHEAGIADIAGELGIGHGTFYRYFSNKLDIAATVLDRAAAVIAERLIAEDPDSSDTLEEYHAQVERIVGGLFDLLDEHPYLVRFFSRQSLVVDPDRLAAALDSFSAITARYLDNGVRKGFLRSDLDVEFTAQLFVAALFDGIRRALRHPQVTASSERFVAATTSLMFDGIALRTPNTRPEGR